MRDFTQLLKNKFKSKKYFRRNTRLGYLPVQSSGETNLLSDGISSSPGLSPQKTISKADVNERLVLNFRFLHSFVFFEGTLMDGFQASQHFVSRNIYKINFHF